MKKIGFIFCFIVFTSSAFGQQFLWSTIKDTEKYIPLENVTNEVLNFYDHYEFYYDGSGHSKNRFLETLEKYGDDSDGWKDLKNRIKEIEDLIVFALRDNLGRGSVILVICVSKDNVNLISFSNTIEQDAMMTHSFERDKFAKWFKTLLN